MRKKFAERVQKTSTEDHQQFIDEIDAKLQFLYSPEVSELESYYAETLSVASPAYMKKTRHQLPDVVSVKPEYLKERLTKFAAHYESSVAVHQQFERMRQMQLANKINQRAKRGARIDRARRPGKSPPLAEATAIAVALRRHAIISRWRAPASRIRSSPPCR